MTRKTIMRYMILSYVLVFRDISERIRRRFPTYNHLVSFFSFLEGTSMLPAGFHLV
ncbi:unnamed protein product [Haemonchus placei]|uniref:Bestrophin homolog n=1 Tax=Haemonchus placei TaxID=6290 RepID=A0A0N4XBY3_HAEPC|nr:unnamed protein product [Haemonchus placei]